MEERIELLLQTEFLKHINNLHITNFDFTHQIQIGGKQYIQILGLVFNEDLFSLNECKFINEIISNFNKTYFKAPNVFLNTCFRGNKIICYVIDNNK